MTVATVLVTVVPAVSGEKSDRQDALLSHFQRPAGATVQC
jgi:hypothetical protein